MNPLEAILALADALGVKDIKALPGAWELKLDDTWTIAANGHLDSVPVEPEGCMGVDLPPFHFAVWYRGWLAGLFNPDGGEFAAGDGANEETFAQAVQDYLSRLDHPSHIDHKSYT